ncbi:hypothetical protein THAOC_10387 [Thalassiosira oceanica]|uniref:Uncharacterized protein n=1 Tax=Thalassiosira oceanica TaxID=159749 RepID=K0SQ47_THAOC|nr:hypothetical protein THAOC_10387 [Thalassiosira oceanica]|eukprot:EJK68433.1 hypothetical protein THAOC_10387 [Thalassiosira oceanica]
MPEDKKMGDSPQKCEEAGSEEVILCLRALSQSRLSNFITNVFVRPKIVVVEPTYRQEPEDNEKFYCSHAAGIAQETLRENLEGLSE